MRHLNSKIQEAIENPTRTLTEIFLGNTLVREIFRGRSPMDLFGAAEGDSPAGVLARLDEIETVPGLRGTTLDGQPVNTIWNQMQAMLAAFNRHANQLVSFLTFPTLHSNEKVGVPTSPGFQVATEFGRPSRVRVKFITRGFPLEHYDLGDGYTQEFIDGNNAAQLFAVQATIFNSWATLRQELVLDALFQNANITDDDGVNVKRLYNGDGEVPPTIKRWTHTGSHTHYLAGGGGGFVQADLDTMSDHLIHHGFREFGDATFVLAVHRDDLPVIRGFANWIPAETSERPEELANSGVVIGQRGSGAGLQVEGYVNDWVIAQVNEMPAGYLLGLVTGGAFNPRNVIGLRRHENPSVAGTLRLVEGIRQRYPLYDSVYDGYVGAGVGQRGAAVILRDNASYVAPTVFATGV